MRKIAVCIFCILLAVTTFAACETDDEARAVQATLVDDALDHMNDDFKAEHMTERAYGAPSDSPKEITYVIKSESDFEAAFKDFPIEIDFDEDMLVLQFFTGDALKYEDGGRRFFYESVGATQEGKVLTAEVVKHKTTLLPPEETMPDASVPTQECLAFVVPRSDVEQVELKIDHKNYEKSWQGELIEECEIVGEYTDELTDDFAAMAAQALETETAYAEKIASQKTLEKMLTQFDKEIDFAEDMLVVCCVRTNATTLDEVQYDKGVLSIVLGAEPAEEVKAFVVKLPSLPVFMVEI